MRVAGQVTRPRLNCARSFGSRSREIRLDASSFLQESLPLCSSGRDGLIRFDPHLSPAYDDGQDLSP